MKRNSFVTFNVGTRKNFGIVSSLNNEYALIVYHTGIKISTIHRAIKYCNEISKEEFIGLVEEKGQMSWFSQAESIRAFYDVTFLPVVSPKTITYKEGEEVTIKNRIFTYCSHYQRLHIKDRKDDTNNAVACPYCHGMTFTIGYGSWECIAHCPCGHSMVVYDG